MSERLFLRLADDPVHAPEATVPEGTLRAWKLQPALDAHVAHLLAYRERIAPGEEVVERVLPDGAVRLIFNLGDVPKVSQGARPALEAVGASAEPVLVRLRGRVEGLSLALRPGATAALLGVPAGELRGHAVPLALLWAADGAEVEERLAAAVDDSARVALIDSLLMRRLRRHAVAPSRTVRRAVQLITARSGLDSLRALAAEVGVGERRLQQLFHAEVGLSPRTFSRLARLHGCLRALRERPILAWAELAQHSGYYDQSHLANEFRALCGLTPSEFMARRVSRSSKTTA